MQSINELWEALLDTEKPKWECRRERNVEKFSSSDLFHFFLGIEDLSLLFANQFCNQRLFLHAAQKKSYISLCM